MTGGGELGLGQIREFLKVSGAIEFRGQDRGEVYNWFAELLSRHEYWVRKEEKRLLRQYAEKVRGTGR